MLLIALGLPVSAQMPVKSEPLAEIDGQPITVEEVEKALGAPLAKLQEQLYTLKRQKVEALIAEHLLVKEAAKRGLTVQTLLDTEVTSKVGLVTEQEIETYYQANKARLQGEEATVREQLRTQLQNQKLMAQRQAFLQSLRSQATVVMHLKAPPVFRGPGGHGWRPCQRPSQRAGDHRRVFGLSLPLLQARGADPGPARDPVR